MGSEISQKNWTVLGGWATDPRLMSPVFGKESTFIDINPLMPSIMEGDTLCENWKDRFNQKIISDVNRPVYLAGWSTGAIIALAIAPILKPSVMVLFSATLSFCRRENFRFGTRGSALESMIQALPEDCSGVLQRFYEKCGVDTCLENIYTVQELIAGLKFLKKVRLESSDLSAPVKTVLFHGKQDSIIPLEAGKFVSNILDCPIYEFEGQHAVFNSCVDEIRKLIERKIEGATDEPTIP